MQTNDELEKEELRAPPGAAKVKTMLLRLLVPTAIFLAACGSSRTVPDVEVDPLPPAFECAGYDCLACASGSECADSAELIEGTCCAAGDSLLQIASGRASEAVDIEANGEYAILCGGFGASVNDVSDPANPRHRGNVGERCQHASFGEKTATSQRFYLTHHGDSWVRTASLAAYEIGSSGSVQNIGTLSEPGVLYEGSVWRDGYLYVAAHAEGLRVYRTNEAGAPAYVTTVAGFGNAWKVDVLGDFAYVVDNDEGIGIVDLTNPEAPVLLSIVPTTSAPRDVHAHGSRVYVALGGAGVDVFDISGSSLTSVANIETLGSAQSVSVDGDMLAVAAWSHVAVYDTDDLFLLGTERTRSAFEQDLGVAAVGRHIFVAEWEGMHVLESRPGFVAPDLWVDEEFYQFAPDEADTVVVLVKNIGRLPLGIIDISVTNEAFSADRTELAIAAGGADVIEVSYQPPGPSGGQSSLQMFSNDPDPEHADFRLTMLTRESSRIDVGDSITDAFGFLDPSGAGQLSGLEGKVVVLAYFALF